MRKKGEIEICIYIHAGVGRAGVRERVRENTPNTRDSRSSDLFLIIRDFFISDSTTGKRGNRKISIFEIIFWQKSCRRFQLPPRLRLLAVGLMMLFEKFKTSGKTWSHFSDPRAEQEAATGGSRSESLQVIRKHTFNNSGEFSPLRKLRR